MTVRGNYKVETRVEYGSAARRNRGRYSGGKVHRLVATYVVGVEDEAAERALPGATFGKEFLRTRRPVLYSCYPWCGCTMGQMAGRPMAGLGPESVTCAKCSENEVR